MAKLTAAERKKIPDSEFAGPNRSFPIHDENHARAALSDVARTGSLELKARIRAAVHRKYPAIGQESQSLVGNSAPKKSVADKMYG